MKSSPAQEVIFGISTRRVPQFHVDADLHILRLLKVRPIGPGTAWGRVPTPLFQDEEDGMVGSPNRTHRSGLAAGLHPERVWSIDANGHRAGAP